MIFLLPRNFSPAFGFIRHKRLGERLSPVGTEVILYRFCSAVKSANGCFASAFITILGCVSARTLLFVAPPMRVVHDTIGIPITGACHLLNLSRNEIRTHRQSRTGLPADRRDTLSSRRGTPNRLGNIHRRQTADKCSEGYTRSRSCVGVAS